METLSNLDKLFCTHNTFVRVASDFAKNSFSHGHLFLSADEFLASSFALAVAKMIVCDSHSLCSFCEGCILASKGTHPDILVYPKGEKFLVSDSSSIVSEAYVKPLISKTKVFVLNNFHLATEQAQNKLLKMFEEPPENVVFLVSASNESKVLITVRSRLSKTFVENFPESELKKYLMKTGANENIAKEAIVASGGLLGGSIKFVSSIQNQNQFAFAKKIVCEMTKSTDILPFASELSKDKENFLSKLGYLNMLISKMLSQKSGLNLDFDETIKAANLQFSQTALIKISELINEAKKQFDANCSIQIVSDKLLFGLLEVKYKWK